MPFDDLASFVNAVENAGELARISAPVDPVLEIPEIADRVVKHGGPALLFERPKGSRFPLLINAFGTMRRTCLAFGVSSLDEIAGRIAEMIKPEVPVAFTDKLKKIPQLLALANFPPRTVRGGPCREVVTADADVDLFELPILQCWPQDSGRFITFPLVITKDPAGRRNVGLYRVQVFDRNTTALHWQLHHDGARHYAEWSRAGKPMPVALALGADPITMYCGSAPMPPNIDELLFAGFLRNKPVEITPCVSIPLEVPAAAEFVIEGWVNPGETRREGPFGDHTGYYSPADDYPVFHVSAVTRRRNPMYPTTIVGIPPQEDAWLGKATERIFLPLLRILIPDIVDYNLPLFGVFHNFCFVKIEKRYPYQARKVMHSIWGAGQMMFSKCIVVVDSDCDVNNVEEVLFRVGANVDWGRDVEHVQGPVDVLDHAAPYCGAGGKIGIDATHKIPGEGVVRQWPELIKMSPEIVERVTGRWAEYGLDAKWGK
jgi:4-hydroxy-3-polyprenylbenzoate decarboxylase